MLNHRRAPHGPGSSRVVVMGESPPPFRSARLFVVAAALALALLHVPGEATQITNELVALSAPRGKVPDAEVIFVTFHLSDKPPGPQDEVARLSLETGRASNPGMRAVILTDSATDTSLLEALGGWVSVWRWDLSDDYKSLLSAHHGVKMLLRLQMERQFLLEAAKKKGGARPHVVFVDMDMIFLGDLRKVLSTGGDKGSAVGIAFTSRNKMEFINLGIKFVHAAHLKPAAELWGRAVADVVKTYGRRAASFCFWCDQKSFRRAVESALREPPAEGPGGGGNKPRGGGGRRSQAISEVGSPFRGRLQEQQERGTPLTLALRLPRAGPTGEGEEVDEDVTLLPCSIYNAVPGENHGMCLPRKGEAVVLHFKGGLKPLLRRWLDVWRTDGMEAVKELLAKEVARVEAKGGNGNG